MAKHQIAYYILEYKLADNTIGNLSEMVNRLLSHINGLQKMQRKRSDFSNPDKFTYLSESASENNITTIIFKSASHSYSAPLIDKNTLNDRPNPKRMEEGEQVKTHIVIDTNSGYMTKDTMLRGIAINNFISYLNSFLSFGENEIEGKFEYYDVPSDTFREEINQLDRVTIAEITTDKQILGSPALGYNGRMEEVQEDISITLKSHRGGSIKSQVLQMILPSLNNNRIRRVRIKGKDEFGNSRTLDSLNLLKKTYVDVEKNGLTGEYDSVSMFTELKSALATLQR